MTDCLWSSAEAPFDCCSTTIEEACVSWDLSFISHDVFGKRASLNNGNLDARLLGESICQHKTSSASPNNHIIELPTEALVRAGR